MATTTNTLALGGCVNGAPVDLSGRAELDLAAGRLELELGSRATPLHWDPLLGLLGLLDAVRLVVVLGSAGFDAANVRRCAELSDDHGREVGHEVLSLVVRAHEDGGGFACGGQYLAASARLEPSERAQSLVAACPTIAMPMGEGSLLITGAARFETDWGNRYRVAAHAIADVIGGELPQSFVEVRLMDGELVRCESEGAVERMRFECGVEACRLTRIEVDPAAG